MFTFLYNRFSDGFSGGNAVAYEPERLTYKPKRSRHFSAEDKRAGMERANHSCEHCGATEHLCYDHELPFARGGASTLNNLQILCNTCNSSKCAKIM